ncbi:MAG: hypothetical protein IJB17_03045 [Oscillospiraceae bacterium]|nr:hypothetical protein [Oscillospiraceae bacterium]
MTTQKRKQLHRIYRIAVSIVTVIAGICLMCACVGIYRSGDKPFSREAVAQAFAPIALPVYLCLALVIGGFILDAALPCPEKEKAQRQPHMVLQRLRQKTDMTLCTPETCRAVLSQCESRRRCTLICTAVNLIAAVVFLIYALNGSNFHRSEINASMLRAMYLFVPCLAVSFASALLCVYHNRKSMEAEIAALRQAKDCAAEPVPHRERKLHWLKAALIAAAVVLIAVGYAGGGFRDVLTKAVNICTECIGLG